MCSCSFQEHSWVPTEVLTACLHRLHDIGGLLRPVKFQHFLHFRVLDQSRDSGVCIRVFWYQVWNFLLAVAVSCVSMYLVNPWKFLDEKGRNIHSLVLACDKTLPFPLWNQSRCERSWRLNYIFSKSNSCKLSVTAKTCKFRLWLTFYNCPVEMESMGWRGAVSGLWLESTRLLQPEGDGHSPW